MRLLAVIGSAHLFDMFDALTMAFVLPVLIATWKLKPIEAGMLLSVGYCGQLLGAIAMGAIAGRVGRRRALRWTLINLSALSLACAFAPSYAFMLGFRFLQGIGLGGEAPVAATFINEVAPARLRGRIAFVPQIMAGAGAIVTAGLAILVIHRFGWRPMFLIGTLPVLLGLFLPALIPESPRWLAAVGRGDEAAVILAAVERLAPASEPVATAVMPMAAQSLPAGGLLSPDMIRGTLTTWTAMLCIALSAYGLIGWLPSIYTTVFHTPLEVAFRYGLIFNAAGPVGAISGWAMIDWLGRRGTFTVGFLGLALPLIGLFAIGRGMTAFEVMALSSMGIFFASINLSGLYIYAAEIYPTPLRAFGVGAASAFLRGGAILAPLLIGSLIAYSTVPILFLVLGGIASVGAVTVFLLISETVGQSLPEAIAPVAVRLAKDS